jgi:sugar-specific transcriptional regulator TrmB
VSAKTLTKLNCIHSQTPKKGCLGMTPDQSRQKNNPKSASEVSGPPRVDFDPKLMEILETKFKLTIPEARAYTSLLVLGQLTNDQLSLYSEVPIDSINSIVEALLKKQLIKRIPGVVKRYRAFAPFKELAKTIKQFEVDSNKFHKDLSNLKNKTIKEMRSGFQSVVQEIKSQFDTWSERQGLAFTEAAKASKTVLEEITITLQQSLTNLSKTATNDFETQCTNLQETLQKVINNGIEQLDEAQNRTLEKTQKTLTEQKEATEQWLSDAITQFSDRLEELTNRVSMQFSDSTESIQQTIDVNINSLTTDLNTRAESLHQQLEETSSTIEKGINAYGEQQHQALVTWQQEQDSIIQRIIQDINQHYQEAWTQRSRSWEENTANFQKMIAREQKRFSKAIARNTTTIHSTIDNSNQILAQTIDDLAQTLENTIGESSQGFQRLQKETKTVIDQWPPSALKFSQFSKIKDALANLVIQLGQEYETLLGSVTKSLGIEVRDVHLNQLLITRELLQNLREAFANKGLEINSQTEALIEEIRKTLDSRLGVIEKSTETFIADFLSKIKLQEEQSRTLVSRTQTVFGQQGSTILGTFEDTKGRLQQFAQERIEDAKEGIGELATTCINRSSEYQGTMEQLQDSFSLQIEETIQKTNQKLLQELAQLQNVIDQYAEEVYATADNLHDAHVIQAAETLTAYKTTTEKQQTKHNRNVSKALAKYQAKIRRHQIAYINSLKTPLLEKIAEQLNTALTSYQTAINQSYQEKQEQADAAFYSVLNSITKNEIIEPISSILESPILNQIKQNLEAYQKQVNTKLINYSQKEEIVFKKTRAQLTQVHNENLTKLAQALTEELIQRTEGTLREMKTRLKRRISRTRQINNIFNSTLAELKQDILPQLSKLTTKQRQAVISQMETQIKSCQQKVIQQTKRTAQIDDSVKTALDQLNQIQENILTTFLKPHLDTLIPDLHNALIEYRTEIENQQNQLHNSLKQIAEDVFLQINQEQIATKLANVFQKSLTQNIPKALQAHNLSFNETQALLQEQHIQSLKENAAQLIQTKVLPNLNDLAVEKPPSLKEIFGDLSQTLLEITQDADAERWDVTEKYWVPLAKSIEDYTSTLSGNLTALNIAIKTALERVSANVAVSLTSFQTDARKALSSTIQTLNREHTSMQDQTSQCIQEMRGGCLTQLEETRTLLNALNQDFTKQQKRLETEIQNYTNELGQTMEENLSSIDETAKAFIVDLQRKIELQKDQVLDLETKSINLHEQYQKSLTSIIADADDKLHEFIEEQIPQTKEEIENLEISCTTKIDEFRAIFKRHLDTFAQNLSEDTEEYISTLENELKILQKTATQLNEKIKQTGETLSTKLSMLIETGLMKFRNTIDEQQKALITKTASVQEKGSQTLDKIHENLITKLMQEINTTSQVLNEALAQISETTETTISQTSAQLGNRRHEQQQELTKLIETHTNMNRGAFSIADESINKGLINSSKTISSILTTFQDDISKILSSTKTSIKREMTKIITTLKKNQTKTLETYTQEINLANTRFSRMAKEEIGRLKTNLQLTQDSANQTLQENKEKIITSLNQYTSSSIEGISNQTIQSGRNISVALEKEQSQLKNETQALVKEVSTTIKTIETSSASALRELTNQIDTPFTLFKEQVSETENILRGLWETLSGIKAFEAEKIWHITTPISIQNHLQDMLRRTSNTATLVYPTLKDVPTDLLTSIEPLLRIHIITSFNQEKDGKVIDTLLKRGNIRIWNNPKIEFFAGTRDGEEVLLAPIHGDPQEAVAVVSDQQSYVALFNHTLGPRWISGSKEIVHRS